MFDKKIMSAIRIDFFAEFFARGLHGLMENIILELPPRAIVACRDVSNNWSAIVDYYSHSKNETYLNNFILKIFKYFSYQEK